MRTPCELCGCPTESGDDCPQCGGEVVTLDDKATTPAPTMPDRDYTTSTDPMAIYAFRQALRNAKRRAMTPETRVVDRTAEFSAPLLRRLRGSQQPRNPATHPAP